MPRPKGSKNKLPAQLKAMILTALNEAGGEQWLIAMANGVASDRAAFSRLLEKILPGELKVEAQGIGPTRIIVISGFDKVPAYIVHDGNGHRPELPAASTPASDSRQSR